MENKRDVGLRTLGDYVDSGEPIVDCCFESVDPITNHLDRLYRVSAMPSDGAKYLQVIPLGDSGRSQSENSSSREPVGILLWQHVDDKRV